MSSLNRVFFLSMILTIFTILFCGVIFAFSGGDGTVNNPYQISDCTELQEMETDLDANYILVNDIDCSGVDFEMLGTFTGILDGEGYAINGLTINNPVSQYVGLFYQLGNAAKDNRALIKNLALRDVDISGRSVGSFVGKLYGAIENSYATGTLKVNGGVVGGVAAMGYKSSEGFKLVNVYSNIVVQGNANNWVTSDSSDGASGLVNFMWSGGSDWRNVFENSYWNIEGSGLEAQGIYYSPGRGTTNSQTMGKTVSDLQKQSTFENWDFENIWRIDNRNNGLPYLYNEYYEEPIVANFDNLETTDFSQESDLTSVEGLVLATSNGKISFPETISVNAQSQDYDSNVVIGDGFVSVNSASLDFSFNVPARLTIDNVDCSNYQIYYASGFYSNSQDIIDNGNVCDGASCSNVVCSNNELSFDVQGFSSYAVGSLDDDFIPLYDCGVLDVEGGNYKLMNDVTDYEDICFDIRADGVSFDLGGYTIDGRMGGFGIYVDNSDSFLIINGEVKNFVYGIYLEDSSYGEISELVIYSTNYGIDLNGVSSSNLISSNIIRDNMWRGINLRENSLDNCDNNILLNNDIYNQEETSIYDFNLASAGTNYLVYHNNYGEIKWVEPDFLQHMQVSRDLVFGTQILINKNFAFVNGTFYGSFEWEKINSESKVTLDLTGLGIVNPVIMNNGAECIECDLVSYVNNVIVFNVPSWNGMPYYVEESSPAPAVSNFDNLETTDFSQESDLTSVEGLVLATSNGKISFPETISVNAQSQDYDSNVVIGDGFVSVNSASLDFSFNVPARLTIDNVDCSNYQIYYASGFYSNSQDIIDNGNVCDGASCSNVVCSNNELSFDVQGFSSYAVGSLDDDFIPLYDCGVLDVEGGNYKLMNDVQSDIRTCLDIQVNNVVLDLNGYNVNRSAPDDGDNYAVRMDGHNGSIIKNGNFSNFYLAVLLQGGVMNSLIENNTFVDCGYAVAFGFSGGNYNNTLLNNDIFKTDLLQSIIALTDDSEDNAGEFNYLVYNNSYGEIRWFPDAKNFLGAMEVRESILFGRDILLSQNLAFINASHFTREPVLTRNAINSSAQVTLDLTGLGIVNPVIMNNGAECTECDIVSYVNNVIVFNVPSWNGMPYYVEEEVAKTPLTTVLGTPSMPIDKDEESYNTNKKSKSSNKDVIKVVSQTPKTNSRSVGTEVIKLGSSSQDSNLIRLGSNPTRFGNGSFLGFLKSFFRI